MNGNPHTPGCFKELRPPRTPQRSSSTGQRKAPSPGSKCSFQTSSLLFKPAPSCRDVSAASWCPSINLGKLPGEQPSSSLPLQPPSLHIPSSIHSLSWTPYETLLVPPLASLHSHPPVPPSPAAVASPSPQALPRWFPGKGRGRNNTSKPTEVRALGEF